MTEADEAFHKRITICLADAQEALAEARSGEVQFFRTGPDGVRVDLLPGRIAHLERTVATYQATLHRIVSRSEGQES